MSWIKNANIRLECDGTIEGTRVLFAGKNGEEAVVPVTAIDFHLDSETAVPVLKINVAMPLLDVEISDDVKLKLIARMEETA